MNDFIPKSFQIVTYWPAYLLFKTWFGLEVDGRENLEGLENRAVIFASNHANRLDGSICGYSLPGNFKFFPIRFLAAKEYYGWFKNPIPFPISLFIAWYLRVNGCIPVISELRDRDKNLEKSIRMLEKGSKVWIYPEGRITKTGELGPGKKGVVHLHQKTGAVIVPAAIIGTYRLFSKKNKKVTVRFGKPIYDLGNSALEEGVEKIMEEIKKIYENA